MRRYVCTALAVLSLCAAAAAAQDTLWRARLSTVPIEASTAASVTGSGDAEAQLRGRKLRIRGAFSGLRGPATLAELHEGPYTGVRGKAIGKLSVTNELAGKVSGTLELTAEQVGALRAGRLYVEIRSKSAPDGNLWGWLLP